MKINITFLIQTILFIFYIYLCIKFIWPYINNVIEKRKKKLYFELKKIKNAKFKILKLNKEIEIKKIIRKNIFLKIENEIKQSKLNLFNKYKKKAKFKYNKIINEAKLKINLEKIYMYNNFNKNIYKIIYLILKKTTYNTFNEKLDNKFISKILNKYKSC